MLKIISVLKITVFSKAEVLCIIKSLITCKLSSMANPPAHKVEEKFFHMLFYLQLVSTKTYLQERGQLCQEKYWMKRLTTFSPAWALGAQLLRKTSSPPSLGELGTLCHWAAPFLSMETMKSNASSLTVANGLSLPAQVICSMTK